MKPWEKYSGQSGPWDKYSGELQVQPVADSPVQTKRGLRERATFEERVSAAAGFPVLPESDLTAKERFDLGLSNKPEEKAAKFKDMTGGEVREVDIPRIGPRYIYRRPQDDWRILNDPGLQAKDLLDRPQDLVSLPIQGMIAATGPTGILSQVLMQAAVPGGVNLLKEGIEEQRGYQNQSLSEVGVDSAVESLADLVAGGGSAFAARKFGRAGQPTKVQEDFAAMEALKELEPGLKDAYLYQFRPDDLVIGRLAAQAESMSPMMRAGRQEQQKAFETMLERVDKELALDTAGKTLKDEGGRVIIGERNKIKQAFNVDPEEAGKAIQGVFTEDFNKKSRAAINAQYEKAGKYAEGLEFDLSSAQGRAKELTAPVNATRTTGENIDLSNVVDLQGRPLTPEFVEEFVNVAPSSGAKVERVASLLSQIDPIQADWRVVKELRSQLGDAIPGLPSDDSKIGGKAKALWYELTAVMENPVGGNKTFVQEWKKANELAKYRFDVYDQGRVLNIMRNDSPAAIAEFVSTPTNLTPTIREVVDKYSPEKKEFFRKNMQHQLLGQKNAVAAIDNWKTKNPTAYNWLVGSDSAAFEQAAKSLDAIRQLPLEKMLNSGQSNIQSGISLIRNMGPSEIESTLKSYGGRQSKGGISLRTFAMGDMLDKAMITKDGVATIDAKRLADWRLWAKRSGVWDKLLTSEDKVRINGIEAYTRNVFRNMNDTGTSLEQAQAVAALKHPSTFFQGLHAMLVNKSVMAPLLVSKTGAKLFKPKKYRAPKYRPAGAYVFAGQAAAELYKVLQETGDPAE